MYHPTVTVSDGKLKGTTTFTWTVLNVNAPPVLDTPGNLINNENDLVSVQLTATDQDQDPLVFTASGLPPGLSISSSGLITGRLPYTAAGVYQVTATVSDGKTTRDVSFTWTVNNVNRPPDVLNPGTQTSDEGTTVSLPLSASDPDNDTPLTFSATGLPPGVSINPSTGAISGLLGYDLAASYTVSVTVKDPGGLSDTETFLWNITNVNRPPIARNDSTSVTQGKSVVINVLNNDEDPDRDPLTIDSVTQPPADQGTVTTNADGTLSYSASATFVGTTTFTYKIKDGKGGTATATVTVTVLSANKPPVCTAAYGGEIWPPNHKRFYIAPISGVTDPDGDKVSIEIRGITQDEVLDSTGDGNFSPDGYVQNGMAWIRAERNGLGNKMPGNGRVYEIFYTATDGKGGSCEGSVFWTVPHDQGQRAIAIDDGVRYDSTGKVPGTLDKTLIHQKSWRP